LMSINAGKTGSVRSSVRWRLLTIDFFSSQIQKAPDGPRASYMPLIIAAWEFGYDAVLRGAPVLVVASAPNEATSPDNLAVEMQV